MLGAMDYLDELDVRLDAIELETRLKAVQREKQMRTLNQKDQMSSHTPGPWELKEVAHEKTPFSERRVYRLEIIAPQYFHGRRTHSRDICQMLDYCEWTDHPANARLIAASPELLWSLERIIEALPKNKDWLDPDVEKVARDAIRKAKEK
jgi:hypothetical protein